MEQTSTFKRTYFDPQHAEYEALIADVYRAADEGFIEDDYLSELFAGEPESVCFTADYLDEAFAGDYDEAHAVVDMVGGRDLRDKINYWTRILSNLS